MKTRFNPFSAAPDAYKAVIALENYIAKDSGLPHRLIHLIKLRASIINGCAFCVDMHVKEARKDGRANNGSISYRSLDLPIPPKVVSRLSSSRA